MADLVDGLCHDGFLTGSLRIPKTAGDLEIIADLRARQISAAMSVGAPDDKGAVGRVSWLARQLADSPPDLIIEAYPKNARTPVSAYLEEVREDRHIVLDAEKRDPYRFRLLLRRDMGMGRKTGRKNPGFITSVLSLIEAFYGGVVQQVQLWQPPAPRMKKSSEVQIETPVGVDDNTDWPVEN